VVTGAMVAEALTRGFRQIGWHCWEHNVGSIGVAEKVGFVLRERYSAYVCHADQLMHKAIQGYMALRAREFEGARRWYAEVAAMEGAAAWGLSQLARCHRMLGDPDGALGALRQAVVLGWREEEETSAQPDFESLRGPPAWHEILAAMA